MNSRKLSNISHVSLDAILISRKTNRFLTLFVSITPSPLEVNPRHRTSAGEIACRIIATSPPTVVCITCCRTCCRTCCTKSIAGRTRVVAPGNENGVQLCSPAGARGWVPSAGTRPSHRRPPRPPRLLGRGGAHQPPPTAAAAAARRGEKGIFTRYILTLLSNLDLRLAAYKREGAAPGQHSALPTQAVSASSIIIAAVQCRVCSG